MQVGAVGREDQRGQRDPQLDDSQHQALPQVLKAGGEERGLQPRDLQVWAGEGNGGTHTAWGTLLDHWRQG